MNPNQGALEELLIYLIRNNTTGLKSMLIGEGYTDISTPEAMRLSLLKLISEQKEAGVSKILEQHPDYEVVIENYLAKNPPVVPAEPAIVDKVIASWPSPVEQAGSHLGLGGMFSMHQQREYVGVFCFLVLVFFAIKILKD